MKETYTIAQFLDLFWLAKITPAGTFCRWKAPEDQQYARAYRIACALEKTASWQDIEVSPISVLKILQQFGGIENANEQAVDGTEQSDDGDRAGQKDGL